MNLLKILNSKRREIVTGATICLGLTGTALHAATHTLIVVGAQAGAIATQTITTDSGVLVMSTVKGTVFSKVVIATSGVILTGLLASVVYYTVSNPIKIDVK